MFMTFTLSIILAAQTNMLMPCPDPIVIVSPLLEATQTIQAQRADLVILAVVTFLKQETSPPCTVQWLKFPLKRYRQLWSQLTLHKSMLCCKIVTLYDG